ncbi:kinase-like domain-containing protein [Xylariaceae sp. FL1651]|nr:kinase-like domain-containing protein [Xylariaceae sp. FL1651]
MTYGHAMSETLTACPGGDSRAIVPSGEGEQLSLPVEDVLADKLYMAMVPTQDDKEFIPRGALEEILNEEAVKLELKKEVKDVRGDNPEIDAREVCDRYRRIFAILVLLDDIGSIYRFIKLEIDDSFLPVPMSMLNPGQSSRHQVSEEAGDKEKEEKELSSLEHTCRKIDWDRVFPPRLWWRHRFFREQWSVLAPVFNSVGIVRHYSFDSNEVLPFLNRKISPATSLLDTKLNERYGGYSSVKRVIIHPQHYNFGDYGVDNPSHVFAVKQLLTPKKEELEKEANVLKRFRNNKHIVQLLASYEIRGEFYLIFPWATENLQSFWMVKESLISDHHIALWMARECYELASALSLIHHDAFDPSSGGSPDDTSYSKSENAELTGNEFISTDFSLPVYGRHGDIKPSNILWFSSSSADSVEALGHLSLGDFGLSEFRREHSRSAVPQSQVARSPTYRPPEFDFKDDVITRKSDIWMLGCTFLEFIMWYLMGCKAAFDDFSYERLEPDVFGFEADTFFRITIDAETGSKNFGEVKPVVINWIRRLHQHERCTRHLHDFLALVETEMIVPDPKDRAPAVQVARQLRRIYYQCQHSEEYYRVGSPRGDLSPPQAEASASSCSRSHNRASTSQRRKETRMKKAIHAFQSKLWCFSSSNVHATPEPTRSNVEDGMVELSSRDPA